MPEPRAKAEEVKGHLRLALGFLGSAHIPADATEAEVRNALSRSYYALFHICQAWLANRGVPRQKRAQQGALLDQIGRGRGQASKRQLAAFQGVREKADYQPGLFTGEGIRGDPERFREFAWVEARRMRDEFNRYSSELETLLEARSDVREDDDR